MKQIQLYVFRIAYCVKEIKRNKQVSTKLS